MVLSLYHRGCSLSQYDYENGHSVRGRAADVGDNTYGMVYTRNDAITHGRLLISVNANGGPVPSVVGGYHHRSCPSAAYPFSRTRGHRDPRRRGKDAGSSARWSHCNGVIPKRACRQQRTARARRLQHTIGGHIIVDRRQRGSNRGTVIT